MVDLQKVMDFIQEKYNYDSDRLKVVLGTFEPGREVVSHIDGRVEALAEVYIFVKSLMKESTEDNPPYSVEDYEDAKQKGLDLDVWNDYVKYYGIGDQDNYEP